MWKSINYVRQKQRVVTIAPLEINVNVHWTRKDKHSEVEVGIMDTNRKLFIFTYGEPLMDGGTLHKDLGTLSDRT